MEHEEDRAVDVICQFTRDGTIIPIKIKLMDEDGESQIYRISAYKPLMENGVHMMPSGIPVGNHVWIYECKIQVFGREKHVFLLYNTSSGFWRLRYRW